MTYTYLALGDSYTIGEGLPLADNFPCQAVQLLRKAGHSFFAPEIIARTGWTTDELADGITRTQLLPAYDFVSLLIGVNNQYRGRSSLEYRGEFEGLLRRAIQFAHGRTDRVWVLSIPDWGVTPFAATHLPDAKNRDRQMVAEEIDSFNSIAGRMAGQHEVEFIDITPHSRAAGSFAADGLHPSGEQYNYWAAELTKRITARLAE
ncbi:MAG: SGNH/GDSL hydrolase family protein [Bacteroidota bacterium]